MLNRGEGSKGWDESLHCGYSVSDFDLACPRDVDTIKGGRMSKKKLARMIVVCGIAIMIIVVITILPSCQSSPTPPAYGLEFDGEDDYIAVGNATAGNTTALGFTSQNFTIEAWIKPGTVTKGMQIFQRHGWNHDGYRLQTGASGDLVFFTFQSGANQVSRTSPDVLIAGNWYHVAAVRQGVSVRLWINGVDKTDTAGSHIDPDYSADRPTFIGTSHLPEVFDGIISEVRIWNYARSESEIKADISSELMETEEGLIGYWKLNEGSGTTAYDSSPNDNHGTLVGDPVWFTSGD